MTTKRNIIALFVLLIVSFNLAVVNAADNITVKLDGSKIKFDVQPQIINDRTMVPVRAIFEALGASVEWDEINRTVSSQKDGVTVKLKIDSPSMSVGDKKISLDSPACIIDGRTLVPVRAISEAYGAKVEWDSSSKTVNITSNTKDNEPEIKISYNEALNKLKQYVKNMLGDEADDITFSGDETVVERNGKKAYKFSCYSKSVKKDGGDGLVGTLFVCEDGTVIE